MGLLAVADVPEYNTDTIRLVPRVERAKRLTFRVERPRRSWIEKPGSSQLIHDAMCAVNRVVLTV
jgi:hypothetical protein